MVTKAKERYNPDHDLSFIRRTNDTRGGIVLPADGNLEAVYPWGANGAMAEAERRRLSLQAGISWARDYEEWHEDVLKSGYAPHRMALVGVSPGAEQLQFVLRKYPQAEVVVIEVDPKKVEGAKATISRTNRQAAKRGRISFVIANAIEYLADQPNKFDFVEADKVAIHLPSQPRGQLYQTAGTALERGGVFHLSDVLAKTWSVRAAPGSEKNPPTTAAIEVLTEKLMPAILHASWTNRGARLWDNAEDMASEVLSFVPSLWRGRLRICKAPFTGVDDPEGMISNLIAISPSLGIEAKRRQQPDNEELAKIADIMWSVSRQFFEAAHTPGVLIGLPDYTHINFVKLAA